ncbi:DUF5610 domain-containing protein [Pseudomonas sp. NCCP-436]|uniref:DUF5610 domain-containing protein n=1 Tax=Pseudomonas sp. NCCP-436 TaxID=2842481 RepID=UPI001C81D575|nr:DUF5610 domain-containing protein [Pseudomonas sp. NCCP-436]GIZ13299.1 hypothetical protein NCCP436_27150 [Pseudomonas sp. NCCP-436]
MNPLNSLPAAARTVQAGTAGAARQEVVDPHEILANRLAKRLGLQPGALSGKRDDYTPEKVAERVLGFIEQRLQSEAAAGADPKRLEALMAQARDGVEKGFAEARKILDGMGVLSGQIATDIDDTYSRIQDGLNALDRRFAGAADEARQVSLSAQREQVSALAESFELSVTTRDGDRLRISVAQASASWSQSRMDAGADGNSIQASASSQSGSLRIGAWQVEIEGELDDGEVKALEKLFSQVQALSDRFYAGDSVGAFDRAMALEMDGEQLASLSLRLTQSSVRQVSDSYGALAGQGASAINTSLQEYARGLLEALRSASEMSEDAGNLLGQLLRGGMSLDERYDQQRLDKAEQLSRSLLDGLQTLLARDAAQSEA